MTSDSQRPPSKVMFWLGWILSILPTLMLLFSAAMKVVKSEDTVKGFEHLGYPDHLALTLAILEVGSTLLYLIPRTAVLMLSRVFAALQDATVVSSMLTASTSSDTNRDTEENPQRSGLRPSAEQSAVERATFTWHAHRHIHYCSDSKWHEPHRRPKFAAADCVRRGHPGPCCSTA
jgi:hypothetical protein